MMIWCMRIACWMRKTTSTHSEYVILIDCPLQQWLHERVLVLHNTYFVCLILFVSRPAMGTTKHHTLWVFGALSPGVEKKGHEAHLCPVLRVRI